MNKLSVPISIVIAGLIIAGAVFYTSRSGSNPPSGGSDLGQGDISMREISESDHILGNPNAQLVIVEYSDFECPFCKTFHNTMHEVIDKYGADGEVAWVFRHFPLVQLHSKAPKEAEATECAAELGGNEAFWAYADKLFEVTPSNNGLDLSLLPTLAAEIGLDSNAFQTCLDSGKYASKVQKDYDDARKAGGTGTPYSVIVARTGQQVPINGAQSFSVVSQAIDLLLGETE